MDSTKKLRDEITNSVHQDRLITLMRQLTYECKAIVIMATLLVGVGIARLSVPNFAYYTLGVGLFGHCYWVGGLIIITGIVGVMVHKDGIFLKLMDLKLNLIKAQIHLGFAIASTVAVVAGFGIVVYNLSRLPSLPERINIVYNLNNWSKTYGMVASNAIADIIILMEYIIFFCICLHCIITYRTLPQQSTVDERTSDMVKIIGAEVPLKDI
ncbi:hypothetical protein TrispH2_009408 [Trichoplax sp. H2]|nr:hypothetical protein TrispH2_009408 [Trichoplax sp. H2]|eukprot:RDD38088.1 hypothetical protein TrispH2_009408 [Trichoplax sp. H2]